MFYEEHYWCGLKAALWPTKKTLVIVRNSAQDIIRTQLLSLSDIYGTRYQCCAVKIIEDYSHPENCLFALLPSGRRCRSSRASIPRLANSFYQCHTRTELTQKGLCEIHCFCFFITAFIYNCWLFIYLLDELLFLCWAACCMLSLFVSSFLF